MLITGRHLLVIVSLLFISVVAGTAAVDGLRERNERMALGVFALIVILAPTLLAGPVFRLLSLRPLILPLCPHCERRHCNYHVPREAWPDAVLICLHCGKPLRLILSGGPGSTSGEMPTATSHWPRFLGLWKPTGVPKGGGPE